MFLHPRSKIRLGIRLDRLICAGGKMVLDRQQEGIQCTLAGGRATMTCETFSHLSYSHLWDEVNCKFRWTLPNHSGKGLGEGKMGVHVQTLCQRGYLRLTLSKSDKDTPRSFCEQILCHPVLVEGTSATAVYPAVCAGIPDQFRFNLPNVKMILESLKSFTLQLTADKASGNLLLLKRIGYYWERVLFTYVWRPCIVFSQRLVESTYITERSCKSNPSRATP